MGWSLLAAERKALRTGTGSDARVVASASCCRCRQPIADWRERLLPIRSGELVGTKSGDLGLRVRHAAGCAHCGDERAEIQVEASGVFSRRMLRDEE
jgi:hypothetical protein